MNSAIHLLDLLSIVERVSLQGSVCIEFHAGARMIGRIGAENGRLCWAVANGQSETITDIFAREAGLAHSELESAYRAALADGIPFGEVLVERRLIRDDDLKRCLARQLQSALLRLSEILPGNEVACIAKPMNLSYARSYTQTIAETFFAGLDATRPRPERGLSTPAIFARLQRPGASALCLLDAPTVTRPLIPLAAPGLDALSLTELLELGREARSILDDPALQAANLSPRSVLVHAEGGGMLCARLPPHLYVFEILDRLHYGDLLTTLLRCSERSYGAERVSTFDDPHNALEFRHRF